MDCEFCDDFEHCSNTPCPYHFLVIGAVKNLMDALEGGNLWGDMLYSEDQAALAQETPEQTAARLAKIEKEDEDGAGQLKHYKMQKLKMMNVDLRTGQLKNKYDSCCRDAEAPAKWVWKIQGKSQEMNATDPKTPPAERHKWPKRPDRVPANAVFYGYGCEPHAEGSCRFLHPGEAGYEEAKMKPSKKSWQVDALAKKTSPIDSAFFLSSKPVATPSTSPATVRSSPQLIDAWYT